MHVWSMNKASAIMGLSMVGIASMRELLVESAEAGPVILGLAFFFLLLKL